MRFCADPKDIEILTGRKQARAQRKFLSERKVRFQVDADGFPVVPIVELERVFGLESAVAKKKKVNLEWVKDEKGAVHGNAQD